MGAAIIHRLMLLDLTESSKTEINRKVSHSTTQLNWLAGVPQDWIDQLAGPKSNLPIARVCLQDSLFVTCQAEYALEQAYAHVFWFQKECPDAPNESDAHYYGRFYVDDAILRLFSAAEHLSNFIMALLDISKGDIRRKDNASGALAVAVGKYLSKQKPRDPVTHIVSCLQSDEWMLLRKYRNDWVHDKPQILDSPGLDYRRSNRWFTLGGAKMIALGGAQKPDITLDDLLENTSRASSDLSQVLSKLTDMYFLELKSLGIIRDMDAGTINPPDDFWTRVPDGIF